MPTLPANRKPVGDDLLERHVQNRPNPGIKLSMKRTRLAAIEAMTHGDCIDYSQPAVLSRLPLPFGLPRIDPQFPPIGPD